MRLKERRQGLRMLKLRDVWSLKRPGDTRRFRQRPVRRTPNAQPAEPRWPCAIGRSPIGAHTRRVMGFRPMRYPSVANTSIFLPGCGFFGNSVQKPYLNAAVSSGEADLFTPESLQIMPGLNT